MLYKVALSFNSVDEILKCDHSMQIKATEQYFPIVLFIENYSANYWVVKTTEQKGQCATEDALSIILLKIQTQS